MPTDYNLTEITETTSFNANDLLYLVNTSNQDKSIKFSNLEGAISLANLNEKSHTSLTDKGTNTHAQIDTHVGAANPHSGSAPSSEGVTNGDSHDHSGGDGGQIDHSALNFDDGTNPHSTTKSDVGLGNVTNNAQYYPGGTDVALTDGGTGQSTRQAGIDALTDVAGATNEHVLTKDTGTGNAIFKAAAGGSDVKAAIDSGATADYVGAASNDGFLRVDATLDYTDGGDFVTLGLDSTLKSNYDAGYTHVSSDGSNHSLVDVLTTHQTLTDAATISWNMSSGMHAQVTLTANRTMGTPTNLKVGYCTLMVIQDAGGTNTLDLSAAVFKFPAGVEPTMSTGGNAIDIISFYCDGTSLYGITNYLFS